MISGVNFPGYLSSSLWGDWYLVNFVTSLQVFCVIRAFFVSINKLFRDNFFERTFDACWWKCWGSHLPKRMNISLGTFNFSPLINLPLTLSKLSEQSFVPNTSYCFRTETRLVKLSQDHDAIFFNAVISSGWAKRILAKRTIRSTALLSVIFRASLKLSRMKTNSCMKGFLWKLEASSFPLILP